VELTDSIFLFDYYQGTLPDFPKDKMLYVFASHKHHDHFDPSIFQLAESYSNITYILSKDIKMSEAYMDRNNISPSARQCLIYIGKNSILELSGNGSFTPIKVETLTSTDEGVAFLISIDSKTIYHAGDLNYWTWIGESDEEFNNMKTSYLREMKKLNERNIQLAFVPLDPRLEERFWWGLDAFMHNSNTDYVFPMHFWKDYSVISKLKALDCSNEYRDKIIDIMEEGQIFQLD
jgi:L-ascorbate metabolism protein UlaG (beta-lactamase superfamily)